MRYVLEIAFKGTNYAGWQRQPNAYTVQEALEAAISTFLRKPTVVQGAGRTDAGVHALQLFVHFDHEGKLPRGFLNAVNGILPKDIAVKDIFLPKLEDFHTRYSATSRAYVYQICLKKEALYFDYSMNIRQPIDLQKMQMAAELLPKYDDFASFCKAHGNNQTTLCRLDEATWDFENPFWRFHIRANRFLRGMVRGVVGTLLWVGEGKLSLEDFERIIQAKDRKLAGPNAPAAGLFLKEVTYPEGALEKYEGK